MTGLIRQQRHDHVNDKTIAAEHRYIAAAYNHNTERLPSLPEAP